MDRLADALSPGAYNHTFVVSKWLLSFVSSVVINNIVHVVLTLSNDYDGLWHIK